MKNVVQLLPDHIANQIAAGEVVQRPASVVKELLENSVDSGATSIDLVINDGGKTLIQVIDDGIGMNETDARLSFERHATSKIRKVEDLFNLHTKGFRGEALASIAAVAQVQMKTKTQQQELGTLIKTNGSVIEKQEMCNTSKGTSISVKNLFFNIPARRNFLKSNQVETRHIIDEFQRVVLTHCEVNFSLTHNDNKVYILPASNLKQRIVNVLGKKISERLVAIEEQNDFIELKGYIGKPDAVKKNRSEQFLFVNERFIRSNYLSHAINKCYENLIPKGYYPSFFIYIKIDTAQIDVNIHPTKTEIKFQNESIVYTTIKSVIRRCLGTHNITGTIDFEIKPNMQVPYDVLKKKAINPNINVSRDFNPFHTDKANTQGGGYKKDRIKDNQNWKDLYEGLESSTFITTSGKSKNKTNPNDTILEEPKQEVAFEQVETISPYQVHSKYILLHKKDGFLFIHQNRAYQRILYDRYKKNLNNSHIIAQKLLFPITVELNKNDVSILKDMQNQLVKMGFGITQFKEDIIVIEAVPDSIKEHEIVCIFENIITQMRQLGKADDNIFDVMCKSMAKALAIPSGVVLTPKEMKNLIDELFACRDYMYSPFGKKIFIQMNLEQIDKELK